MKDGTLGRLYGKSLLLTDDYSADELDALVSVTERLAALDRAGKKAALLSDELAYALFFDNSTRTKSAWAGAAARLGMQPVIVDGSSTQVSHGRRRRDGAMLGMNARAGRAARPDRGQGTLMRDEARHRRLPQATKDPRKVPVVNLQCDIDHPTQTLATSAGCARAFPKGSPERRSPFRGPTRRVTRSPLGAAGLVVADAVRRRRDARASRGYPLMQPCLDSAAGTPRNRAAPSGSWTPWTRRSKGPTPCTRRAGVRTADALARRGEPRDSRRMAEIEGSLRRRPPPGLDLRRAPDGIDSRRRRALHALPPADIGAEVSPASWPATPSTWRARPTGRSTSMAALATAKVKDLSAAWRFSRRS